MNRRKLLAAAAGSLLAPAILLKWGCTASSSESGPRPLRFAITDVEGLEQLQREFGAFRDLLQKKTRLKIDLFPMADRNTAVTALENDQIDLVITGPAEYVVFRSRTPVIPLVGLFRPDYTAVFLVRTEDRVKSLAELRGKKIALGDVGSTSKHIAPLDMLAKAGVKHTEIEPVHLSVRSGWETLLHKDVFAFGTTKDKWLLLKDEEPDAGVELLAESGPLPMDVLLASPKLSDADGEAIKSAIASAGDDFIAAILTGEDNQKYRGMQFRLQISDADYDEVRSMFKNAGLDQFAA